MLQILVDPCFIHYFSPLIHIFAFRYVILVFLYHFLYHLAIFSSFFLFASVTVNTLFLIFLTSLSVSPHYMSYPLQTMNVSPLVSSSFFIGFQSSFFIKFGPSMTFNIFFFTIFRSSFLFIVAVSVFVFRIFLFLPQAWFSLRIRFCSQVFLLIAFFSSYFYIFYFVLVYFYFKLSSFFIYYFYCFYQFFCLNDFVFVLFNVSLNSFGSFFLNLLSGHSLDLAICKLLYIQCVRRGALASKWSICHRLLYTFD